MREITIVAAVVFLNIEMTQDGAHLRGICPACKIGALVVTPICETYFCSAAKTGGDSASLVSHVLGISKKSAGQKLSDHFL